MKLMLQLNAAHAAPGLVSRCQNQVPVLRIVHVALARLEPRETNSSIGDVADVAAYHSTKADRHLPVYCDALAWIAMFLPHVFWFD